MEDSIVTVKDLIVFLESNFRKDDKMCFFDDGGAYCELETFPTGMLGKMFFRYVKDKRECELNRSNEDSRKHVIESYWSVKDNDVVIY